MVQKMAEAILYQFGKVVLDQLGSAIIQEVKLVSGFEDELDKIKSNMESIQAVLQDAEKQQATSQAVKTWLGKLQDVMYDIDDLLDGIATEITINRLNEGHLDVQVRKFFSRTNSLVLRWKWARQVKKLCTKLDIIAFERNSLVLSTEYADTYLSELVKRETTAHANTLILGRDGDKEAIIESILNCGNFDSLSVLPIVGFDGLGKTTLAQLLYNDKRIDEKFDKKMWVYVSENFNLKKVLKQVISMVTEENILQLTMEQLSMEQLRLKMREALKDRKYLLVLDDVWNEDSNEWRKLRDMLDVGAKGSTVLVTTRGLEVASIVQTVEDYKLPELSRETCLEIFKKLAFKDGEMISPTLLDLADKIVEKSRGLPLLVTALGNLLRGEKNEKEWDSVIQKLEQGHEDILKVLALSYDQLSPYSKLCFRILSLFNKGEDLYAAFQLLPLWMALGLLPYDSQGRLLGRSCMKELVSKSLLIQQETGNFMALHDTFIGFRMHDFVHDLATSMAGEEVAEINRSSTENVSGKARYIRVDVDDMLGKVCDERLLTQAKKARLLVIGSPEQPISKAFLTTIFSKLPLLRVLGLKNCQFEEMPRTVGYMTHLRELSLGGNMKLKQLPNSICNLVNLLTLDLMGCTSLEGLPSNIGRLEKLQILGVTVQHEFLPEGIGHLKGLRSFIVIACPNLVALPLSVKQLENLETLFIKDCEEVDLTHGGSWLEGLKSLQLLVINAVPKLQKLSMEIPNSSLECLCFNDCEGLVEVVDWIKYFPSLKALHIVDCPQLMGLSPSISVLDKLEYFGIEGCPVLSKKCTPDKGEDWHLISNIPNIQIETEDVVVKGVVQRS